MLCELLENSCWSLLKKIDKNDVLISESDDYGTLIQSNITCFSTSMNTLKYSVISKSFSEFLCHANYPKGPCKGKRVGGWYG